MEICVREPELQRLNCICAALAQINQAIVRAHSRDEFFNEVCRILVESGGFSMTWVGWLDSATQDVRVVAQFGDATKYLSDIHISAKDCPTGRGPTGTSVREDRPYICNDFLEDPHTLPWREAAAQAGWRASIALPIHLAGKVCGALSVYAREVNFFGEREVYLLKQTAMDTSFALDNLEREARRRKAEQALEDAARCKDEFLAMLGHELRNPLAPIRNAVQILKIIKDMPPQAEKARAMIERQTIQLTHIVDDLLDASRISRGKIPLRRERMDFAKLVQLTCEDHRYESETRGLTLAVSVPSDPVWILGDATRLTQVLNNLLNNAAKFSDDGARIAVALQVPSNHKSKEGSKKSAAVLTVKDTGIGMSAETLLKIFVPFVQAETDMSRSRGGLGLGLALVKGLVDLHDGTIQVTSKEGRGHGSEFTVQLPLESAVQTSATELEHPASHNGKDPHARSVLIIEDNVDTAESMKILLELYGHTVYVALDGKLGLQKVRQVYPDVILCDIGLPGGMDGLDVAREIRKDLALRDTYLIAMTGYDHDEDKILAREAGFNEHVAKPADPAKLEQLLDSMPAGSHD